jgi:flavodoxin
MNTLVLYDSQFGNTERVAQTIATTLSPFGSAQTVRIDPSQPLALKDVDLLILGGPTQAFGATTAIRELLAHISSTMLQGREVACFDTRVHGPWGSAAHRIARHLRTIGVSLVVPPESFFVTGTEGPLADGELERAAAWARAIHDKIVTLYPATRS